MFDTFKTKHLGKTSYILGIKIISNKAFQKLSLAQGTYIKTLLTKFEIDNQPFDSRISSIAMIVSYQFLRNWMSQNFFMLLQ